MSVTPCGGPMKAGEGRLCGNCDSQIAAMEHFSGICVRCELGKGFKCVRQTYV